MNANEEDKCWDSIEFVQNEELYRSMVGLRIVQLEVYYDWLDARFQ